MTRLWRCRLCLRPLGSINRWPHGRIAHQRLVTSPTVARIDKRAHGGYIVTCECGGSRIWHGEIRQPVQP